ncbi:MAG: hypothetical protein ACKVPX_01040 [Myxococcaceae bacterium]
MTPARTAERPTALQLFRRVLFALSRKRELLGIEVAISLSSVTEAEQIFTKVEAALQLTAKIDPRQFSRLRRAVRRIWVRFTSDRVAGEWFKKDQICVLSDLYVLDEQTSTEELALLLVHESSHAWLQHLGISQQQEELERREKICVRAERAFARKLGAASVVAMYDEALQRDRLTLTTEEVNEGHLEFISREIPWLARLLRWHLKKRNQ